jgi:hypothetical protein
MPKTLAGRREAQAKNVDVSAGTTLTAEGRR